jgi:flagellar hook-length control protein FliK
MKVLPIEKITSEGLADRKIEPSLVDEVHSDQSFATHLRADANTKTVDITAQNQVEPSTTELSDATNSPASETTSAARNSNNDEQPESDGDAQAESELTSITSVVASDPAQQPSTEIATDLREPVDIGVDPVAAVEEIATGGASQSTADNGELPSSNVLDDNLPETVRDAGGSSSDAVEETATSGNVGDIQVTEVPSTDIDAETSDTNDPQSAVEATQRVDPSPSSQEPSAVSHDSSSFDSNSDIDSLPEDTKHSQEPPPDAAMSGVREEPETLPTTNVSKNTANAEDETASPTMSATETSASETSTDQRTEESATAPVDEAESQTSPDGDPEPAESPRLSKRSGAPAHNTNSALADSTTSPDPAPAMNTTAASEPAQAAAPTPESNSVSETTPAAADSNSPHATNPATQTADRFSPQLFSQTSNSEQRLGELSQADQTRFIRRVAQAIEAAPQRGGTLRLRLHPPELGSLSLEVVTRHGSLTARIETDTHAARSLLMDHLHELRERLDQQGVRIERFDVDVSRHESEQKFQHSQNQRERGSSQTPQRGEGPPNRDENHSHEQAPTNLSVDSSLGNINVVI